MVADRGRGLSLISTRQKGIGDVLKEHAARPAANLVLKTDDNALASYMSKKQYGSCISESSSRFVTVKITRINTCDSRLFENPALKCVEGRLVDNG